MLNPWLRITVPLGYKLTNLSPPVSHFWAQGPLCKRPVSSRSPMATHGFYGSIPRVTKRSVDINKGPFMAGHKRALNARCHIAIVHPNGSRSCPEGAVALPSPDKRHRKQMATAHHISLVKHTPMNEQLAMQYLCLCVWYMQSLANCPPVLLSIFQF